MARHIISLTVTLLFSVTLLFESLAFSNDEVTYERDIKGVLSTYCFDCHANGAKEGNVDIGAFLQRSDFQQDALFWDKLLRNIRAGVMPPGDMEKPSVDEVARLASWIKSDVFKIDESNPDPGPALVRRINRNEYRNTIRDLMGYDYQTDLLFPADDTGYGFDNNAAALNVSQILVEKYLKAAEEIVTANVPMVSRELVPRSGLRNRETINSTFRYGFAATSFTTPVELRWYSVLTVRRFIVSSLSGRNGFGIRLSMSTCWSRVIMSLSLN